MRRLILVAAIALISPASHAGQSRGLSLASTEATQPAPAAGQPTSQARIKTPVTEDKSTGAAKLRRKHIRTEARIIRELHRHGIYW